MTEQQANEQRWMLLVQILRKIAEKKGISQQEIANRTGLKRSNVSRTFALRFCPSLKNFIAIARAINVNFFFEDQDGETELSEIYEAAMKDLGRRPDNLSEN